MVILAKKLANIQPCFKLCPCMTISKYWSLLSSKFQNKCIKDDFIVCMLNLIETSRLGFASLIDSLISSLLTMVRLRIFLISVTSTPLHRFKTSSFASEPSLKIPSLFSSLPIVMFCKICI